MRLRIPLQHQPPSPPPAYGRGGKQIEPQKKIMGKITGFMEFQRLSEAAEAPQTRLHHYREFVVTLKDDEAKQQGEIGRAHV